MSRKWLRKGAIIEVFTENDWWNAEVIVFNKNFVRIHYVGGSSPRPSRSALRIHALSYSPHDPSATHTAVPKCKAAPASLYFVVITTSIRVFLRLRTTVICTQVTNRRMSGWPRILIACVNTLVG